MLAALVYLLGALVTGLSAALLTRGYLRSRSRLLLWSGLCFAGLTTSNVILFLDLVVFLEHDLYLWRLSTAAVAMLLLVYGLVFESE